MDHERFERWVDCSFRVGKIKDDFLIPVIQDLGRLDSKLIPEDKKFLELLPQDPNDPDAIQTGIALGEHITISYLWVLGAYEFIRTLDERCRNQPAIFGKNINRKVNETKREFERVRVPLAKLKVARNYPSDSRIAFPAFGSRGVAWRISKTTFIQRRELSDKLLELLEELPAIRNR